MNHYGLYIGGCKGIIAALGFVLQSTNTPDIFIDCTSSGGPDITLKRGREMDIQVNDQEALDRISMTVDWDLDMVALNQNLIEDYGSLGNTNYIADQTPDFYRDVSNAVAVRADSDVVALRKYAHEAGLEVIHQVSGTPYYGYYHTDEYWTDDSIFSIRTSYSDFGDQAGNWYPLPSGDDVERFGLKLADWMAAVEETANDQSFTSIWCGTQEPSHTLGLDPSDEDTDDAEKKLNNCLDYIDMWSVTAKQMKLFNPDYKVCGIQLNGTKLYVRTLSCFNRIRGNGCPLDFWSIQNYDADGSNGNRKVINGFRNALNDSSANQTWFADTKILYNRYGYATDLSRDERFGTSTGINRFLDAEIMLLDNCDVIYGYCMWFRAFESSDYMILDVLKFLQSFPESRRTFETETGLKGFAASDSSKLRAVVWNSTTSNLNAQIYLKNIGPLSNKDLTVRVGNGGVLSTDIIDERMDDSYLPDIYMPTNSFALIELN